MKKFIAVCTLSALVFSSSIFAIPVLADDDIEPEIIENPSYQELYQNYMKDLNEYMQDLNDYNDNKDNGTSDDAELNQQQDSLKETYQDLRKDYFDLKIEYITEQEEYKKSLEEYNTKKEIYNNFEWDSYREKVEQYEKDMADYLKVYDTTRKIKKHGKSLFYSLPEIVENAKDLRRISGKEVKKTNVFVTIGKGATLNLNDDGSINIISDGDREGFGIYDIYFVSGDIVYHMMIDMVIKGTFVIIPEDSDGNSLTIDNILGNRDTQDILNNPPKSPYSPDSYGSEPDKPELSYPIPPAKVK